MAGRAPGAWPEARTTSLRAPTGGGRTSDGDFHAGAPRCGVVVVAAAKAAFASDPELGLCLRSRREEPAEAKRA